MLKQQRFLPLIIGFFITLHGCQQFPKWPGGNNLERTSPQELSFSKAPVALAEGERERLTPAITNWYNKTLGRSGRFNGSVLVAKNGNILFEQYQGVENLQTKTPLTPHSAFHLASVSKTFTGMAICKLWQEGKLNLDDSIQIYFPNLPYPGITIRMLLTHRSGLPNYVHYLEQYKVDRNKWIFNQDVLQSLYTFKPPLQYPTGKHFSYCNTNYALLALIVEKVSGKSFAAYCKEVFFKPLGMNDTFVFSKSDSATVMPSYESNGRLYPLGYLDGVVGDKNIYSTVRDMLKWDQALYDTSMFAQSTLQAAFTGYSNEKPGVRNYGLGWRMFNYPNGKQIIYHNGWWHGNNTVFTRLYQDSATIIVLGNRRTQLIYNVRPLYGLFGAYDGNGDEGSE